MTCIRLWHQTDLYQSCPVIAFYLHMDTSSLCALHVFCLNQLTLVLHLPGRCINSLFLSSLCTPDKPDLDIRARDPCWATYPGAKACWLGVLPLLGLYWRVQHQMLCAIFRRGLWVVQNVGRFREQMLSR